MSKRRGKGEGSIYRRSDGRWEGAVTVGITAAGNPKRVRRYGRTRTEVAKKLTDLLAAHGQGLLAEPNQLTVEEWLRQWLADASFRLEDSTVESYQRLISKHIVPAIGKVKLSALRPLHLKNFYLDLAKQKYSLRTRQYIHGLIVSSLKAAVRLEFIPRNVAEVVRPEGKDDRKEIEVWTPEEAAQFLNVDQTDRLYPAFYLMLCLGLRRGELLGLRWSDIDLKAGVLSVRQTLGKGALGRPRFSEPKTQKSRSTLSLPGDIMSLLLKQQKQQGHERAAARVAWQGDASDLVFTTELGTYIHPDNLKRPFKRICRQAAVKLITLHGLRHTYTSLARNQGLDAKVVSLRLGHADVGFTLRTYQHIYESQDKAAALSLSELVGRRKYSQGDDQ